MGGSAIAPVPPLLGRRSNGPSTVKTRAGYQSTQ